MPRKSVKEAIVVAAVDTLHRRGFNATGVQDITAAAGVPKGSFYNHFDSKEALGVEALDRYWQRGLQALEKLSDPETPPLARLRAYFERLREVARDNRYEAGCMIGNLAVEMSDQSRPFRDRLALLFAAWTRSIETCVRDGQADGSIRTDLDPGAVAAFLLNAWEGAVLRAKADKDDAAFAAFDTFIFTTLRP